MAERKREEQASTQNYKKKFNTPTSEPSLESEKFSEAGQKLGARRMLNIVCRVKSTPSVNGREEFARLIFINRILDELAHLTRYFIVSKQVVELLGGEKKLKCSRGFFFSHFHCLFA